MDEHTLRVLEYYKVRELVKGYASSEPGRAEADKVLPSADPKWVERSLKETDELRVFLESGREFPIHGLKDVSGPLNRAAVEGAMLRPEDLLHIAVVARTSRLVKAAILRSKGTCPLLFALSEPLGVFEALEAEIGRAISDEGEVLDSASFELKRIRRGMALARSRINKELERIIQDPAYAKAVQEPVITIRADRYVVPLKPNFKMYLQGIVHDHSTSRSTVFVEPSSTVELNNRLAQFRVDERREVERVLYGLTARVREEGGSLGASLGALAGLDLLYAKAAYASAVGANMPALRKGGAVELTGARHPLLIKARGADTVPLDIKLGGEYGTLVITGPNTGGKTVVLKTVGLLMLMAQAGMLIPAGPDSSISVFENIFSDIGDEQSLEQSLSTFSSHISQIVKILDSAGAGSLVLLDELGAGTDPVEGSALGVALLEELHSRGCKVIVTTHHGALKVFASNTQGVMNASVEFDTNTLMPTYRLLIGRPGRSNALFVAGRLGMPRSIIEAAEKAKGDHELKLDGLIERMERESSIAREDRARAAQELARAREERVRLQELLRQAEADRQDAVRKAKDKAASLLSALRQKVRELEELGKGIPDREKVKEKAKEAAAIEAELGAYEASPAPPKPADLDKLSIGDTVRVQRYRKQGKVLAIKKDKGQVVVQVDAMRMTLSATDIEPLAEPKKAFIPSQPVVTVSRSQEDDETGPGIELKVIGLRVEEALERVDRYIDDCLMAGIGEVRIIHGRGTGALRKAVREMLDAHRGVVSRRAATYEEGGDAVTIASLRG